MSYTLNDSAIDKTSYTLNGLVSDLIRNGLPEDYFDPLIPINFSGKQYVADFRDLAILDIMKQMNIKIIVPPNAYVTYIYVFICFSNSFI